MTLSSERVSMPSKREQWNEVYTGFHGNRQSVWRENATPFFTNKIDYLKYKNVKVILDAGCGDGRNLVAFAKSGFKIIGVDVSDVALKKCRQLAGNNKNVILKRELLEELSLKPASVDTVICDFVLVHVEKIEGVLSNFHKVLKKNGFALLEFISTKDERCNRGRKIGRNQYLQHGVFIRTFELKDIEKLLGKFKILFIESESYTDPHHGRSYHRKNRHAHHSYFVMAQKL